MSFSNDIKNELCQRYLENSSSYSCFAGIMLFVKYSESRGSFSLCTSNRECTELFSSLCRRYGKGDTILTPNKESSTVSFFPTDEERSMIPALKAEFTENRESFFERRVPDAGAFCAGAFIGAGSISDPEKDYHLEITTPDSVLAEALRGMLNENDIPAGLAQRGKRSVVYVKSSEAIEDLLTLMGATRSSIDLMNTKILKDVRNKANRIANCDNANIERTLKASERQIEDIRYIVDTEGFDSLSPELRDMAMVRLENPDVSLSELGTMLEKTLGRSGVNHRLRRLSEIAAEMRERHGTNI